MRILLTGANGFIGSHLAQKFIQNHELGLLLRTESSQQQLGKISDKAQRLLWDGEAKTVLAIIEGFKPELVIHLASLFLATHKITDIDGLIASNIRLPTLVLEAALTSGCKHFIHTGSAWQHFGNAEYDPVNLYAATKQSFSDILSYYVKAQGISALTLELTDTYGPDDPRPKLIPMLRKSALENAPLSFSPGGQLLDLVHVDDVVAGYETAIQNVLSLKPYQEKTYMLRSGEPLTLKSLVTLFNELSPHKVKAEWGVRAYRARETMEPWTWGETLPNWRPCVRLRDGLAQMVGG